MSDTLVRESLLQERVNSKIWCNVCARRCVIPIGGQGWCRTRENRDGILLTLIYGAASPQATYPIEKKPLFHFYLYNTFVTNGYLTPEALDMVIDPGLDQPIGAGPLPVVSAIEFTMAHDDGQHPADWRRSAGCAKGLSAWTLRGD